ncbi:aminopeptidase N-like [Formica exsecta]|uniref:aminopeptidase N-like n=1 Tax=Formica exsecta TaxID=72781 RepID=UPI001143CD95|nr:aminopeptidase N-like [Formica exsecta]
MMKYLLPLMLALATCWAGNPLFENVAPELIHEVLDDYRLPDNVVPKNYVIELTPYLDTKDEKTFTFDGYSKIDLDIKKNTTTITFHAKQLKFKEINLMYKNETENITIADIILNKQKDFVTLVLKEKITSDMQDVKLILNYTGVLKNDELRGFYNSSYQNKNNETRWLATTHFEPVGARQAFPCWDEPAIKATFTIIINTSALNTEYRAVSNMLEDTNHKETNKTIFFQTPKMSTYLVAFVVSDYKKKGNETFGVWTRPNAINSTEFALKIGQETLKKLKTFTGIGYYQPSNSKMKMDQISIPDFGAGAMENWGLVTYRESALLYTEGKTTTQDKQSIATVIVHEFSHQWFGNLVTCDWWDYIWLNEGFATFFQYYTTEQVVQTLFDESWRLMDQFVIKNLQASAFVIDATTKTRPLNSEINTKTPNQIQALFDDIAYKKGASILRMLQKYLGEDVFQKGLKKYLNKHKYNSVTPYELFEALEKIQTDDIKKDLLDNLSLYEVMDNWLNKAGYPVVTVERPENSTRIVYLKQQRFYLVKPAKQDTTQWYIPITYVTEEAPENTKSLLMKPESAPDHNNTVPVNDTQWILFNKDQTGYYRVNYYPDNWNRLAVYLQTENYKNISNTNRAQLIDDALNLARAGYLNYDSALQITKYLNEETDYIPWYAAIRAFDYLDRILQGMENHDKYHAYVAQKIEKFANEVNYTDPEGSHVTKLGKVLALDTACKYGQKDCENFAKGELEQWLKEKGGKKLSPDLRRGIICAGLRKANAETWQNTLKKFQDSTDIDERGDILNGLGCASMENIDKLLNSTIEENAKDIFSVMNSIAAGNAKSFDALLDFINKHINEIKKIDENNKQLSALLNKLAIKVTTDEQYIQLSLVVHKYVQEFEKFTGLAQAIENLAWIKTYRPEVQKWLDKNHEQKEPNSASSFTLASFLVIIPVLLARFN